MDLSIRDMTSVDTAMRVDYFHQAPSELLDLMGVDGALMPPRDEWLAALEADFSGPLQQRKTFGVVWLVDDTAIGFSTVSHLTFGEQAHMHLHIVDASLRAQGHGTEFVRKSARRYFEALELKRLYSEPHALNPAPNRTLQNAGFRYVSTQVRSPGPINYVQTTNLWVLERS